MKRRILSCWAVFWSEAPWPSHRTSPVTSPNGGESWELGKTQNITWTYSSTPNAMKVKLVLWKDGAKFEDIAVDIPSGGTGTGSYPWSVGTCIGKTATAAGGYKIRIRAMNDPNIMDESNQSFIIAPGSGGGGIEAGPQQERNEKVRCPYPSSNPRMTRYGPSVKRTPSCGTAGAQVKYPLSIFLVSSDHKVPIVDIGKAAGPLKQKSWTVTDNLYDGQYCIRITSADRVHEVHSAPFTIKASKITKFEVLPFCRLQQGPLAQYRERRHLAGTEVQRGCFRDPRSGRPDHQVRLSALVR